MPYVMKDLIKQNVATIVTHNINTASVFRKYKIDFSFHGNMLLSRACEEQNINLDKIVKELISVNDNVYYLKDYNAWELDFLIDFLVNIHHEYEEQNILFLKEYGKKVAKIYGNKYKELLEINLLIHEVTEIMLEHMKNEERIVFPYIKELIDAKNKNNSIKINNSPLSEPVESLEDDHEKVGKTFKKISELTNNYKVPENTCINFKVLYLKLQQFEEELYKHIHIENNILFPKAKKLEQALLLS
jgi:regulator of cell morphogenesis and NO signaling